MPDIEAITKIMQGGGNAALLVCLYFMWKLNDRLTRIEMVLNLLASKNGIKYTDVLKAGRHMSELTLTLLLNGTLELTNNDGDTLWTSDNDDSFTEAFDDIVEESELDAVGDWLDENGYLENSLALFYVIEGAKENDDD